MLLNHAVHGYSQGMHFEQVSRLIELGASIRYVPIGLRSNALILNPTLCSALLIVCSEKVYQPLRELFTSELLLIFFVQRIDGLRKKYKLLTASQLTFVLIGAKAIINHTV